MKRREAELCVWGVMFLCFGMVASVVTWLFVAETNAPDVVPQREWNVRHDDPDSEWRNKPTFFQQREAWLKTRPDPVPVDDCTAPPDDTDGMIHFGGNG
jgi:hypothetical protein